MGYKKNQMIANNIKRNHPKEQRHNRNLYDKWSSENVCKNAELPYIVHLVYFKWKRIILKWSLHEPETLFYGIEKFFLVLDKNFKIDCLKLVSPIKNKNILYV